MIVCVKLFAAARQIAQRDAVEIELVDGASVGDLRRQMAATMPELADLLGHVLFAIDSEYADDPIRIPAGADIACIPPVSGG